LNGGWKNRAGNGGPVDGGNIGRLLAAGAGGLAGGEGVLDGVEGQARIPAAVQRRVGTVDGMVMNPPLSAAGKGAGSYSG
jgi:hypothetical protein